MARKQTLIINIYWHFLKVLLCWGIIFSGFLGKIAVAQSLPDTLVEVKKSIVAVGTFLPKRSPRSVFLGTGFVIGDGSLVITNAHVIPKQLKHEHLETLAIFLKQNNKNKIILATQIAVDKKHDIAVLKLSQHRLPPLKLSGSKSVREGQSYAFTGFPIGMVLGLFPVTHQGIISAISPIAIPVINAKQLNKNMFQRLSQPYNVYQLDATAYPGNSGSPLYDIKTGHVVAVINKVFVQGSKENLLSNPSGITYAIPIKHVKKLLSTIR